MKASDLPSSICASIQGPIALIGMRAAGKTSVGALLAQRLRRPFLDLDNETVTRARQAGEGATTTAELLQQAGQAAFRSYESQALRRLLEPGLAIVLATGGGVVERSDARCWLRRAARTIWLDVPLELLRARVQADGVAQRPSLTGIDPVQELGQLLARRRAHYAGLADHVVNVEDLGPEASVEEVTEAVLLALANLPA